MSVAYGVSVIQFEMNKGLNDSDNRPLASLVERGGFEPPKASPTDLQSVPFGRSGTSPTLNLLLLIEHFLLVYKKTGKSMSYISGIKIIVNLT